MYTKLDKLTEAECPGVGKLQRQYMEKAAKWKSEYNAAVAYTVTHPFNKKLTIISVLIAICLILCAYRGIIDSIDKEVVTTAEINSSYTGKNQGANWDYKYEFSLTESGILSPRTMSLGIASDDNLFIFKADDMVHPIYCNWLSKSPYKIYLEKGDYVALVTPACKLDYSTKGYSLDLLFESQNQQKAKTVLKSGQVYKDTLSESKNTISYEVQIGEEHKLVINNNQPVGEYLGKADLFNSTHKLSQNVPDRYAISCKGASRESITTTGCAELSLVGNVGDTCVVEIEALTDDSFGPFYIFSY